MSVALLLGSSGFSLVNDLDRGRVLHVAEGRRPQRLDGFWLALRDERQRGIQAVAMDMWTLT